jgi:hypothetical protein
VVLGFQKVQELPQATWPDGPVPQQLHLDTTVPTKADLDVQHERALALGARLLQDRSDDPEEPLRVYADPAGHPFCIFVAAALTRELSHCPFGIMNLNFYRTGRGSPRPYRGAPRWGAGAGVVRWSHANGRCLPFPARRP